LFSQFLIKKDKIMKENTFQWSVLGILIFIALLSIFNAGATKERKSGSTKYSFAGKEFSLGKEKKDKV